MQRWVAFILWLCVGLVFALGLSATNAAERNISLMPGVDLPGSDYKILQNVDVSICQSACLNDNACRAFTFNDTADWCFLKGEAGEQSPFADAISGIVEITPTPGAIAAVRQAELPFPAGEIVAQARQLAQELPVTDPAPEGATYEDLVTAGNMAASQSNHAGAIVAFRQALSIVDNDPAVWFGLAKETMWRAEAAFEQNENSLGYDLSAAASHAAINAYLRTDARSERASILSLLARALEGREMWRQSIATYRASLALVDNADLQARLDSIVAEHGFRIVSHEVDAETATPRICMEFSEPLPSGNTDLSAYVVVENAPRVAVETEQFQICVEGVSHGNRYHIRLRAGLPSDNGETLRDDVDLDVYVPDRQPFVAFANNAYVLPAGLGGGLPITSVNAETADVVIYRIGDRSIAAAVRNGIFQSALGEYSAENIAFQYGEITWEGQVDLSPGEPNAVATTAIPVTDVLTDIQPGAYVITAKVPGVETRYWEDIATQWFIVTDLGLTSVSGNDGVHAFVRSLDSAEPVANATVQLIAVNNEILGVAQTDADGRADFAPGLARGTAGSAPQLLVAETASGDYAFLDVTRVGFDLTDRGVEGRPSPGPLDLFATTERGVYRPGETVFLTALLRDPQARAVTGLPLTMDVERPDGVVSRREVLNDSGAGSYFASLPLVEDAMRGSWTVRLYADPKANSLAHANFLVEDFEPERLAFEISADQGPIRTGDIMPISVSAKYLYGATAPDLSIEADVILRPRSTLAAYPGYTFGRLDDNFENYREPLGAVGTTDENGQTVAEITLPETQATTRPLEAQIILHLVDTNGRTVERNLTRPVLADFDRIGIRPQFGNGEGLSEGSEAGFDIITVAPDGELAANKALGWTLSRIETHYQWYRDSDIWRWEAITTTRRVADGTVNTAASGPVSIAAQVDWGRYQLEIHSTGPNPTSTSYEFYAGYYYAEAGSDTPDTLQVALDKTSYRVGETASLRLDPQFAGTALVMVVDDHIIDMVAVPVPADGTSVDLTVTDDWGPGAYVTAMLYRPASAAEERMPARALGLAFAEVDPGDRLLDVGIDVDDVSLPLQPVTATISLGNVAAGERAYVAVAAVDLGILNLTNFKTPDPDGWFFGQRQLGVQLRDLYGQLIDPTQGGMGALRSGGDGGGAARLGTPPPTSVLVAMHSGIVEAGPNGTATVSFDMPDFSGTVRIMAMAWTADAVGHAERDIIVRDPVVITLSPPRFLRLGDQSRLLVEVNNISGPAGTYRVALEPDDGLTTDAAETSVDLAVGERAALNLGLTGANTGDHALRVILTGPNGETRIKELVLGVRAPGAPRTTSRFVTIQPGGTLTLDAGEFSGLLPHTGELTLALGPIARLDMPGLLWQMDRYPYGCVEQVTSRAMPLLYLNEVAQMIGIGSDDDLQQTVQDAITDVLSKQRSNGSFGVWGPFSYSSLWLDSYVTEFLLRARDEGYDIPDLALSRALDNLGNQLSYASDFSNGGEDIAYALYDLARAGRAAIGDLRYYLEARLDAFGSPLAKAQLGAALALYGDRTRAAEAFQAAIGGLKSEGERFRYRADYGSLLRDTAGVLALAAEFTPSGIDISALATRLGALRDLATYTSTQEDAWTLIAAAGMARDTGDGSQTIDGTPLIGSVYRSYEQEHFEAAMVSIVNTGNQPLEAKMNVTGIPATPPPASSQGFDIERQYFTLDGVPADISEVRQNDRFVVHLRILPTTLGSGQYIVADPLPAGFEIENPDLSAGSGVADLGWLNVDNPTHVEARTDQFVAAFRYQSERGEFTTAYMVRAVSPGNFVLPGATVEDMYRPELRGNTEAGSVEVTATGQ